MLEQTFTLLDLPRIFTISFLEMLLSADNAVVLGILAYRLPPPQRRKALFIGVISAFALRAGAIWAIALLLSSIWVQLLSGLYLIYLSIRYCIRNENKPQVPKVYSFWKVVLLIECFDLVFAIDSIVAALAFINGAEDKLWLVYLGGMIGLIGMRYAADIFGTLITKFPKIEQSAYLMVGWIGIKLILSGLSFPLPAPIFWGIILLLFVLGFFQSKR